MIENVFVELSIIIILAVVVCGAMRLLRQPLIIGYIITGIITGPFILNIVQSTDTVALFSHFGVVFLLFIAGLSLNPNVMRSVGKISLITGLGQILFTTAIGFLIAKSLGFPDISALYIAVALTFSSTIIIVKLLSDKGDLQTLYGRISMGFLIVQDIVAVIILMIISSTAGTSALPFFDLKAIAWMIVVGGIGLLFILYGLSKAVDKFSKSPEFLLLFSIGWLLLFSILFGLAGFSVEIGALLAGISLSITPHHHEIKTRMNILRDFFILFFFVLLGSQMLFTNVSFFILPIIIFSLFILIGNPLIVMLVMGWLRYTKRSSFRAGLTVAQISEFSLILVALGVRMGHLTSDILSMVTAIGLITIFGSVYMITHDNAIYRRISSYLSFFEKRGKKVDEHSFNKRKKYDILLFGYNRLGFSILPSLKDLKSSYLVVDYDPQVIDSLTSSGVECLYGDAENPEFLSQINLSSTKMIISTIPDTETNISLIKYVRRRNRKAIFIVVSHRIENAIQLYKKGATYVIMPYFLGGDYASHLIKQHGFRKKGFLNEKERHIAHLRKRAHVKHEHPKPENHRH